MNYRPSNKKRCFIQDTRAYIPFAVIGTFILLFAVISSVYLAKTDYELAETIHTADITDMERKAVEFASADIARCLNYAGMEALAWQGEHPVIRPEDLAFQPMGSDGFSIDAHSSNTEAGEMVKVSVGLPSDIFQAISCLFSEKPRSLILKRDSGTVYRKIDYDEAHSFWSSSEFEEELVIPDDAEYGYAYLILEYDGETKAVDWFHVGTSPLKDITANYFNKYLSTSYQDNRHTFSNYAVNIVPHVEPSQIRIDKINGSLKREISRSEFDDPAYPIYYSMTVADLEYTLVDLTTGTSVNDSMNVTAIINSRQPLLEELVNEYENELNDGVTSDIVLGATNIRTFIYGPWQHYLNGPLNIVTGPSLSASVNSGTLYTQKRVFDSVDPWALTYTTYYNGKVLHDDVKKGTSSYEADSEKNLSTTYQDLSDEEKFNINVHQGINDSMRDANTTMEEVEDNSKIVVSVSNFTNEVYSNWVYNDEKWSNTYPDLLHDVTHEVYSGTIQAQVFRDGFNSSLPYDLWKGPTTYEKVSYERGESEGKKAITWASHHPFSISHTCALSPDHTFSGVLDLDHEVNVDASSHDWYFKEVKVDHVSTDIDCEGVDVTYRYAGNDSLVDLERKDDYLFSEDHAFDWEITYNVRFRVRTLWDLYYRYHWSYHTYIYNPVSGGRWKHYSGDSSGSLNDLLLKETITVPHEKTETEYISIVYHQYLPSGGYKGLDSVYVSGSSNDYKGSTVFIDGTLEYDPGCSDAADKYRQEYVDLREIENDYNTYNNGTYLSDKKVYCDIPSWLHKNMSQEMESMFDAINKGNPSREVSLLGENLGKDPTALIQDASLDLADEMADPLKRESFVEQVQYTHNGQFSESSAACRAIAKNEAYDRLLRELRERNKGIGDSFEDYIEGSFADEQGHSILDLVKNEISTDVIFNNPAMDKASTALATEMGIIETMEVVGQPGSRYSWTEDLTLVVDQYPDYLYHDPDFDMQGQYKWIDEANGREVYPLAVRNVCVFSTGIGDDIANMLTDASDPLKDSISSSMSRSISDANAEIDSLLYYLATDSEELAANGVSIDTTMIEENRTRMMTGYSKAIRQQVPATVASEIARDPVLSNCISTEDAVRMTKAYLVSLPDEELVELAADSTLQDEITFRLSKKIRDDTPSLDSDEMDAILYRLEADLNIGFADGVCTAVQLCQGTIDDCFENINNELQNKLETSTEKLTGQLAIKTEKRLQRSMKYIPCGLPVIPPHWVCTVNVWEYEVKGEYHTLKIIDNDNKCIFNPYFGHDAQCYVRKDEEIYHPVKNDESGGFIVIGRNKPVSFKFSGYAATIVGPGPKGVGDKVGDRDEKSKAYDDFELQF